MLTVNKATIIRSFFPKGTGGFPRKISDEEGSVCLLIDSFTLLERGPMRQNTNPNVKYVKKSDCISFFNWYNEYSHK